MEQITRAILLGCARKYVAMINAGARTPITSLQYFADIVEEVKKSAIPESYWEPLRSKMARIEQRWQKRKSSNALMPKPVGQPRLPHIQRNPKSCHSARRKRNDAMDIFYTRCLTDVVHLNHPETSQRRFAPTPDHFTGIRTSREIAEYKTPGFFRPG